MDLADFETRLDELTDGMEGEILFVCDLMGASPFRTAAMKCAKNPDKYVTVTGQYDGIYGDGYFKRRSCRSRNLRIRCSRSAENPWFVFRKGSHMKIEMFDNRMIPEIVALWNRELAEDQISGDDFVRWHIADMTFQFDLLLVATDGGKAVGFLFGIKRKVAYYSRGTEPDKCWIKAVAVDEHYQDASCDSASQGF